MYFIHAELNAVLNAAACGTATEGCSMYVLKPPCAQCAGAIINAGIIQINYLEYHDLISPNNEGSDWMMSLRIATEMLVEANVLMRHINGG